MAAGAAYQTREWPNRALYVTWRTTRSTVFPIRYEDDPQEVWTVDPSVFPREPDFCRRFPIRRAAAPGPYAAAAPLVGGPGVVAPFPCNIPSRRRHAVRGAGRLLKDDRGELGEPRGARRCWCCTARRAWARASWRASSRGERGAIPGRQLHHRRRRAGAGGRPRADGHDAPRPAASGGAAARDQAVRTLAALAAAPALLIYDNALRAGRRRSRGCRRPGCPATS